MWATRSVVQAPVGKPAKGPRRRLPSPARWHATGWAERLVQDGWGLVGGRDGRKGGWMRGSGAHRSRARPRAVPRRRQARHELCRSRVGSCGARLVAVRFLRAHTTPSRVSSCGQPRKPAELPGMIGPGQDVGPGDAPARLAAAPDLMVFDWSCSMGDLMCLTDPAQCGRKSSISQHFATRSAGRHTND